MKFLKNTITSYSRPFLIGGTIFTVLTLHFAVSQFIALDNYRNFSVSELINRQPAVSTPPTIEPETEWQAEISAPKDSTVLTVFAPEIQTEQPTQKTKFKVRRAIEKDSINRKRIIPAVTAVPQSPQPSRETRAERLRRAEKVLTGV